RRPDARVHAAGAAQDLGGDRQDRALHHPRHQGGHLPGGPPGGLHAPAGQRQDVRGGGPGQAPGPPRQAGSALRGVRGPDLERHRGGGPASAAGGGTSMTKASSSPLSPAPPPRGGRVWVQAAPEVRSEAAEAVVLSIPGKPGALRRLEPYLIGGGAVALVLLIWQAVAAARLVPSLFLPGPLDIAGAEVEVFRGPAIWVVLATRGVGLGAGFALAMLAGLPTGLLMGWFRRVNHALDPFI